MEGFVLEKLEFESLEKGGGISNWRAVGEAESHDAIKVILMTICQNDLEKGEHLFQIKRNRDIKIGTVEETLRVLVTEHELMRRVQILKQVRIMDWVTKKKKKKEAKKMQEFQ